MKKFYIYLILFLILLPLLFFVIFCLFFSSKSTELLENKMPFYNREDGFSGGKFLFKDHEGSYVIAYPELSGYKNGKLNGSCVRRLPYMTMVYEFKDGDLKKLTSYDISDKLVAECTVKYDRVDDGTLWEVILGPWGIKDSIITHWKDGKWVGETKNFKKEKLEKLLIDIYAAQKIWENEDIPKKW